MLSESFLEKMLDDAEHIQKVMLGDYQTLCLAMEQLHNARAAVKTAQAAYDDAEDRFLFEIAFDETAYPQFAEAAKKATNDSKRKMLLEYQLLWARTDGPTADAYTVLVDTKLDLDRAQLAYDQADKAFHAVDRAASLQSAELLSLAGSAMRQYGQNGPARTGAKSY